MNFVIIVVRARWSSDLSLRKSFGRRVQHLIILFQEYLVAEKDLIVNLPYGFQPMVVCKPEFEGDKIALVGLRFSVMP